jgi:glutathione synthase/RimK-type ligase-like ATP-grasp enzyme
MPMSNLLILDRPARWTFQIEGLEVVSAKAYVADSRYAELKSARVFNLCQSYRYQSIGYYVSLLAEARDHRAIPSVTTMQDFRSQAIIRTIAEDVDGLAQKTFQKIPEKEVTLYIYFGQTLLPEHRALGRQLYNLFQAPLLKTTFIFNKKWLVQQVAPITLGSIPEVDLEHVQTFAQTYFSRKRFPNTRIQQYVYDLAVLVGKDEVSAPSCPLALRKFAEAAEKQRVYCEFITRDDFHRLSEFDILFIRETTAVNHHTYRFARKAYAEGLVVIDDPWSIMRCTNKVYLAERLAQARVPTPRTLVLQKESLKVGAAPMDLHFPCVLKQPDSAFSLGVVRAENEIDFRFKLQQLFEKSDLVIAQEFMATDYDWRIGILDGRPLFACKYYMARGHWQVCNWAAHPHSREGASEAIRIEHVPELVLDTALKAANLIGDGLYGVDLKELDGKVYVIEVNDNPSIDAGVEDAVLNNELYQTIIQSLIRRVEEARSMRSIGGAVLQSKMAQSAVLSPVP